MRREGKAAVAAAPASCVWPSAGYRRGDVVEMQGRWEAKPGGGGRGAVGRDKAQGKGEEGR